VTTLEGAAGAAWVRVDTWPRFYLPFVTVVY